MSGILGSRQRHGNSRLSATAMALSTVILAIALCCTMPLGASAEDDSPSLQAGGALLGQGSGLETQASEGLEFISLTGTGVTNNTLYIRDGDEATVTLKVKNVSGKDLEYVSMTNSPTCGEGDDAFWPIEFPPLDSYADPNIDVENAEYMGGQWLVSETEGVGYPGFFIATGATAEFRIKVNPRDLAPGTYNWAIDLGRHRYDFEKTTAYYNGYPYDEWPCVNDEIEEVYLAQAPIKVVVYNQANASLTVGENAGTDYAPNIDPPAGGVIDFGTIDLATAEEDSLAASRTLYAKNSSPENVMTDGHGNTTSITVVFDGEAHEGSVHDWNYGPFSWGNGKLYDDNWSPLPPTVTSGNSTTVQTANYTIFMDATSCIAGTYTGNIIINTTPHKLTFNGTSGNESGAYRIPFRVTLTGVNPRLLPRATNLHAEPGNGQVELTWTPGDGADEHEEYTIYRREGAEPETDPDKLDWNLYEYIGTEAVGTSEKVLFVDGSAENDTTYSYTVICDEPYHSYAASPVSATPDATKESRLQAPTSECYGCLNYIEVSWHMNDNYGGERFDGAGMVDHFNIYRDGILVDQVYQSAVSDSYDSDTGEHAYSWTVNEPVPELYTPYSWTVSAVSASGVEGYLDDAGSGCAYGESPYILSHQAWLEDYCYDEETDEYAPAIKMYFTEYGIGNSIRTLEIWKREGTEAPDTAEAPYAEADKYMGYASDMFDFADTDVVKGATYTYTVRGDDGLGGQTEFYTFTIKAIDDTVFEPVKVDWGIVGGTTARLKWQGDYYWDDSSGDYVYSGMYKVYRNDALIKTVSGQDGIDIQDDPGADGTYVYRVDKVVSGIPDIRGRSFTFIRNTQPVDPGSLLQAPDAPTLTARTATGTSNVILSWKPAATGGAPEGYHIYRKDAGEPVIGHYSVWNGWTNWPTQWGMNRYLTIRDAETLFFIDGCSNNYNGNSALGVLTGLSWRDEKMPHEYYITAYNHAGESAPSQTIVFDTAGDDGYGNAIAPPNPADEMPAAPSISRAWVDWEDDSSYRYGFDDSVYGCIRVAWEDSSLGGAIDRWTVTFAGTHAEYIGPNPPATETLDFYQALLDPAAKLGTSEDAPTCMVNGFSGDSGDLGRAITVDVAAENAMGAVASEAVTVDVNSLPRFYALPGNGEAVLRWTDLLEGTDAQVTGWEIWRKAEYGLWERLDALPGTLDHAGVGKDGSNRDVSYYEWKDENADIGWTYQYKVVAKCADGTDRPSVVREVTPTWYSAIEAPGAPQDFTHEIVDGAIQFQWTAPSTGGMTQDYYVMAIHQYSNDQRPRLTCIASAKAPSTSTTWVPEEPGTYRCFVYAASEIDTRELPYCPEPYEIDHDGWTGWSVDDYTAHLDELHPSHSSYRDVTVTQEDIATAQAAAKPGDFTLSALSDENQIQLSWTASANATHYEIERRFKTSGDQDRSFPRVTLPVTERSYVDATAEPGVSYMYRVAAKNYGSSTYSEAHATAAGKSRDRQIAEQVEALIGSLPSAADITIGDCDLVLQVNEVYQSLTDQQKKLVSAELSQKLAETADAAEILQIQALYGAEAAPVQEAISNLPEADDITLDDEATLAAISDARAAFNALPPQARRLVDISKLEAAETAIRNLRYNLERATVVTDGTWLIGASDGSRPTVTVTMNGATLTEGTDFRVVGYIAQGSDTMLDTVNAGGAYTVVVEGMGPYFNRAQSVDAFSAIGDLATAAIVSSTSEYVYSGQNVSLDFSVSVNGVELRAGTDYSAAGNYEVKDGDTDTWVPLGPGIPKDVGTYRVNLIGIDGGYYVNSKYFEFSIAPATLTATYAGETIDHDGEPSLDLTVTGFVDGEAADTADGYVAPAIDRPAELEPGKSYKLTPYGGSARNYVFEYVQGTLYVRAENPDLSDGAIITGVEDRVYDGTEQRQNPTVVMGGKTLELDTDYELSYSDNTNAGTATMTIRGIGCYKGERDVTFTIAKQVSTVSLSPQTKVFNGAAQAYDSTVKRTGSTGALGIAYYSDEACSKPVDPMNVKNAGTYYMKATLAPDGNHTAATSESTRFVITALKATPSVALSANSYTYNGKVRKPDVTVKVGTTKLTTADYAVSYASGCKKVGAYKVTVKLKRNYAGTKAVTFTIVPKKTALAKLTPTARGFTAKWKKQAVQTTGYQLQYSLKSNFKSSKTLTVKGPKTLLKKVAKLKAKKKYYVRVRTYKAIGKARYYSAWSKAKTVKTR